MKLHLFLDRRRSAYVCVLLIVAAAVFCHGYDRIPADFTQPLVLQGEEHWQRPSPSTFRVATYNIRGGRGRDDQRDLGRTASTLEGHDLIALQEVHGACLGRGNNASELGERLGMSSLFVPTERRWWHDNFGNGMLSRMPIKSVHPIPLPGTQGCKYRNAILATITYSGTDIRLLATHVDRIGDHDRQLRAVLDLFLQLESPAILMGDLNSKADDPQLRALLARPEITDFAREEWPDGRKPLRRVDWIILRGLRCVSSESRDLGGSDHAAVCAEIELINDASRESIKHVGYQRSDKAR